MNVYQFTDTGDAITSPEVHGKFKSDRWDIVENFSGGDGYVIRDADGNERTLRFVASVDLPDKINRETVDRAIKQAFAENPPSQSSQSS